MKTYIDFDGVIIDSEKKLFEDYHKLNIRNQDTKKEHIQKYDWTELLDNSEIINNAIEILKELSLQDIAVLTKVFSADNEGAAKIKSLRKLGIFCEVILVPYNLNKTDVVDPKGNILVDDTVHNLDDWNNKGGIPIFFNKDNLDIDGWDNQNKIYTKINRLDKIKNYWN